VSAPKCSLVGRDVPKDGRGFIAIDADTGELFAVVSLADWEALAAHAEKYDPCMPSCAAPGCVLARRVLAIARTVES
jgi:hypothetical protein